MASLLAPFGKNHYWIIALLPIDSEWDLKMLLNTTTTDITGDDLLDENYLSSPDIGINLAN